jgi:hypothetical protein
LTAAIPTPLVSDRSPTRKVLRCLVGSDRKRSRETTSRALLRSSTSRWTHAPVTVAWPCWQSSSSGGSSSSVGTTRFAPSLPGGRPGRCFDSAVTLMDCGLELRSNPGTGAIDYRRSRVPQGSGPSRTLARERRRAVTLEDCELRQTMRGKASCRVRTSSHPGSCPGDKRAPTVRRSISPSPVVFLMAAGSPPAEWPRTAPCPRVTRFGRPHQPRSKSGPSGTREIRTRP